MKPVDIRYYPLPNGEFVVSYFDPLRRSRISQTFKEERKATESYNELRLRKPITESKRSLKDCSVEELLHLFFDEVPEAKIFKKSRRFIDEFLQQFAIHRIEQITETDMRCFYARQKMEYDYTSHSLATRKYQVQGFFKWAVSRGIIKDSPQAKISMGRSKVYKRPKIWVKPNKMQQALAGIKKLSPGFIYPMVLLVHETAAKTSDLIDLTWKDVDFKNKKVLLRESEKIQRRLLPISDELLTLLKSIDQVSDRVFTTLDGRPIYKHVLTRELHMLKKQLGITESWVFRDLRHSFAINFLKVGGEISELQKILGHNHVRMTEEIYGRYKVSKIDFGDENDQ